MLVHLLTVVVVVLCTLLFTWLVFRTLKRRMPGYLIPMLVAGTAIAYGIYAEYTWASRTLAQLPPRFTVVHEITGASMFSPWAYLVPRVERLSVVDTGGIRTHPAQPDVVLVELLLMQRFQPTRRVPQLIDCRRARRADLSTLDTIDAGGLPDNLSWRPLAADHPLAAAACP